jgi:prevent-host-death family protein
MSISREFRFLLRVGAATAIVVAAKVAVHAVGWEVISLNALFTGIIAANVFLMGFLLSGVLSDYKESERLPGEVSASLENIAQEVMGIALARPDIDPRPSLRRVSQLSEDILSYLFKKLDIAGLLESVNDLTVQFAGLDPSTQATWIARLKQEQSNLRRSLIRINTIRETSFVSTGYLLADIITILLCTGLVLTQLDPFYESLLFSSVIAYLMVFLLLLIRDLDNPFGYYEGASSADVSLDPLRDTAARLAVVAGTAVAPKAPAPASKAAAPTPAAATPAPSPAAIDGATARGTAGVGEAGVPGVGVVSAEDFVRLRDLKEDPAGVIRYAGETGRPVLITSRGRVVAVVQAMSSFESRLEDGESSLDDTDGRAAHAARK